VRKKDELMVAPMITVFPAASLVAARFILVCITLKVS